jgi:hypothetical protein
MSHRERSKQTVPPTNSTNPEKTMKSKSFLFALATIAAATFFAAPMLGLSDASAKSLKCYPTKVSTGTYVWNCTTGRP